MKRNASKYLLKWFDRTNRKPLILRGARQVGKSTLVRIFCEENNIELIEINLEKQKIKSFLDVETFSIKKAIDEIEVITKKKLTSKAILFIDEIQEMPMALNRLRYFYEERNDLKVIAAGPLLEAVLEKEKFSMPVGRVEYYNLGPMSFSEFLMAKGEDIILEQLNSLNIDNPPNKAFHEHAIELLKEFFIVGGMPEAVKEFVTSGDKEIVKGIHKDLYRTFLDDIPKYSKNKLTSTITEVFEKIPGQIGEEKVIFSGLANTNSDVIKNCIDLLRKAGLIYKVTHSNCSGLPLKSNSDASVFKLFFLDVGLYNTIMGVEWSDIFQLEPDKLLLKGKMGEQFIAQHLSFLDPKDISSELFYWLRGKKKGAAEVDFILSKGSRIFPLEIKSGSTGKMRSMWQFLGEKKINHAIKMDLKYRENIQMNVDHSIIINNQKKLIKCKLLGLPLYCVEFIDKFL